MDRDRTQPSPETSQPGPVPAEAPSAGPAPASPGWSTSALAPPEPASLAWRPVDTAPPEAIGPGAIIDEKYEVEALLGKGGMSRVYAATHRLTCRRVALKCLLSSGAPSLDPRRLLQEARAIARIEHPHVVQVLDVGFHGAQPYLVMERLRGEPLSEHLRTKGVFGFAAAVALLDPVLDACHRFHEAGVVHRDLKPGNLFLVADGVQPPALKVMDFGVASLTPLAGDDLERLQLTASGTSLGTPIYMAPEQLRRQAADRRSDVFALAAILHEMVTGERAFPAQDLTELIILMVSEDPSARERRIERAIPALGAVLARALAHDPDARFQSVEEFRQALRRASSGSGAPAAPRLEVPSARVVDPRSSIDVAGDTLLAPPEAKAPSLDPWRAPLALQGQLTRRRWWVIGLSVMIAAAAALVGARRQSPVATAVQASALERARGSLQPPASAPEPPGPSTEAAALPRPVPTSPEAPQRSVPSARPSTPVAPKHAGAPRKAAEIPVGEDEF